jgi:hypothetical protein
VETGWPTQEKLKSLGLDNVHGEMAAGATAARERLPELAPVQPVKDHHRSLPIEWE